MTVPSKSGRGKSGEVELTAKKKTDGDEEEETGGRRDRTDEVQQTVINGLVGILAGIQQSKALREKAGERRARTGNGASTEGPPRAAIGEASTMGDVLFDFARLQVDTFERLLSFQRKHSEALFEGLSGVARSATSAASPPQPIVIKDSSLGSAEGTFFVENQSTKSTHVALRVSQLRSRDGEPPFAPQATFHVEGVPPGKGLRLDPDEELQVTVRVDLQDPRFKAGKRYRGHVVISMPGRPKIELPLRVDMKRAVAEQRPSGQKA